MQKILFVTNAKLLNFAALEFAGYIAKQNRAKLVGVFLEELMYKPYPYVKTVLGFPYVEEITAEAEQTPEKEQAIETNIDTFRNYCAQQDIVGLIHRDKGSPAEAALEESRFADLIITDAATSFSYRQENVPTRFVRDMLEDAECPVIVAPDNFEEINEIVLCYDGSKSSVLAIKLFAYLFPAFANRDITLLHIEEDEDVLIEARGKMMEWLQAHYTSVNLQVLFGDAGEQLFKTFLGRSDKMLVLGAMGRGTVSNFFRQSTAELLLEAVDTPVFIAHM